MNTKNISDPKQRKEAKRGARKKAAPKAPRPADQARGSAKKKVSKAAKGQRKR